MDKREKIFYNRDMDKEYYESAADSPGYIYFRYSEDNRTPAHFHDSAELIFVESGGLIAVGNGRECVLGEGDVFFADAYVPHLYHTQEKSCVFVVVLSSRYLRDFREYYRGSLPMFMKAGEDKNAPLFCFLRENFARWDDMPPLMRTGFADWVLGFLAARYPPEEGAPARKTVQAESVLRYIDEHYAEPLTMAGLAERFGYSPNYFSSLFHRCLRTSFRGYLGGVRLKKTEELLRREPHMGVGAAARACGFESPNTYYRAKKRRDEGENA